MRRKFNSDFSIPPQPVKSEHSRVTHRRTVFRSIRTKHSLTIERFVKLNIRPVNKFQHCLSKFPIQKRKKNSTQLNVEDGYSIERYVSSRRKKNGRRNSLREGRIEKNSEVDRPLSNRPLFPPIFSKDQRREVETATTNPLGKARG